MFIFIFYHLSVTHDAAPNGPHIIFEELKLWSCHTHRGCDPNSSGRVCGWILKEYCIRQFAARPHALKCSFKYVLTVSHSKINALIEGNCLTHRTFLTACCLLLFAHFDICMTTVAYLLHLQVIQFKRGFANNVQNIKMCKRLCIHKSARKFVVTAIAAELKGNLKVCQSGSLTFSSKASSFFSTTRAERQSTGSLQHCMEWHRIPSKKAKQ